MTRDFASVTRALLRESGVTEGRMFGSSGLKRGTRVFAMEVKGALVVKLDAVRASELCAEGVARPFDPGHGRPLREWIAVARSAPIDWLALAREALAAAARAPARPARRRP